MLHEAKNLSWSWDIKVETNGDVYATLTERNTALGTRMSYTFPFEASKIISFIKRNCKQNRFYQVNLEGRIDRSYHAKAAQIRKELDSTSDGIILSDGALHVRLNPTQTESGEQIAKIARDMAFNQALLTVFRGVCEYDSPYRGGTNAVFDFLSYIGIATDYQAR